MKPQTPLFEYKSCMKVLQRKKTTFGQLFSIFYCKLEGVGPTKEYELKNWDRKIGPWDSVDENMEILISPK